ncbi:MAG: hypothetical protein M1840_004939 [Geoglossum simile]|nr:MAG: hypothetical protein M1840_004939 [Geoglossum simile]
MGEFQTVYHFYLAILAFSECLAGFTPYYLNIFCALSLALIVGFTAYNIHERGFRGEIDSRIPTLFVLSAFLFVIGVGACTTGALLNIWYISQLEACPFAHILFPFIVECEICDATPHRIIVLPPLALYLSWAIVTGFNRRSNRGDTSPTTEVGNSIGNSVAGSVGRAPARRCGALSNPRRTYVVARPLTFGVELELILCYSNDELHSWVRRDGHWRWGPEQRETSLYCEIANVLNIAGIPTYDPAEEHDDGYVLWSVTGDGSVKRESVPDHQTNYLGMEVKTLKYQAHDPRAEAAVRKAIRTLRQHFTVFVNDSCGLHVHVGDSGGGFSLNTLKNLATLLLVYEPQLNCLHPWRRVIGHWSAVPGKNIVYFNMTSQQKAHYIDRIQTVGELADAMNGTTGGRSVAYSFSKSTIEFRIHQGSVDADEILNWVDFVIGLVTYAECIGDVKIYMDKRWSPSVNSIIDLMNMIGRPHLVDYYKDRLYNHSSRDIHEGSPPRSPVELLDYSPANFSDIDDSDGQESPRSISARPYSSSMLASVRSGGGGETDHLIRKGPKSGEDKAPISPYSQIALEGCATVSSEKSRNGSSNGDRMDKGKRECGTTASPPRLTTQPLPPSSVATDEKEEEEEGEEEEKEGEEEEEEGEEEEEEGEEEEEEELLSATTSP